MERFAEDADLVGRLREYLQEKAVLISKVKTLKATVSINLSLLKMKSPFLIFGLMVVQRGWERWLMPVIPALLSGYSRTAAA